MSLAPETAYRYMVLSALADGEIAEEERSLLVSARIRLGLSPPDAERIRVELAANPRPALPMPKHPSARRVVIEMMLDMVAADGEIAEAERQLIDRTRRAFGISTADYLTILARFTKNAPTPRDPAPPEDRRARDGGTPAHPVPPAAPPPRSAARGAASSPRAPVPPSGKHVGVRGPAPNPAPAASVPPGPAGGDAPSTPRSSPWPAGLGPWLADHRRTIRWAAAVAAAAVLAVATLSMTPYRRALRALRAGPPIDAAHVRTLQVHYAAALPHASALLARDPSPDVRANCAAFLRACLEEADASCANATAAVLLTRAPDLLVELLPHASDAALPAVAAAALDASGEGPTPVLRALLPLSIARGLFAPVAAAAGDWTRPVAREELKRVLRPLLLETEFAAQRTAAEAILSGPLRSDREMARAVLDLVPGPRSHLRPPVDLLRFVAGWDEPSVLERLRGGSAAELRAAFPPEDLARLPEPDRRRGTAWRTTLERRLLLADALVAAGNADPVAITDALRDAAGAEGALLRDEISRSARSRPGTAMLQCVLLGRLEGWPQAATPFDEIVPLLDPADWSALLGSTAGEPRDGFVLLALERQRPEVADHFRADPVRIRELGAAAGTRVLAVVLDDLSNDQLGALFVEASRARNPVAWCLARVVPPLARRVTPAELDAFIHQTDSWTLPLLQEILAEGEEAVGWYYGTCGTNLSALPPNVLGPVHEAVLRWLPPERLAALLATVLSQKQVYGEFVRSVQFRRPDLLVAWLRTQTEPALQELAARIGPDLWNLLRKAGTADPAVAAVLARVDTRIHVQTFQESPMGKLPPPELSGGEPRPGWSVYEVENGTDDVLTVFLDGPDALQRSIPAGGSTTLEIPSGAYSVYVTVTRKNVIPFQGSFTLRGRYRARFVITSAPTSTQGTGGPGLVIYQCHRCGYTSAAPGSCPNCREYVCKRCGYTSHSPGECPRCKIYRCTNCGSTSSSPGKCSVCVSHRYVCLRCGYSQGTPGFCPRCR